MNFSLKTGTNVSVLAEYELAFTLHIMFAAVITAFYSLAAQNINVMTQNILCILCHLIHAYNLKWVKYASLQSSKMTEMKNIKCPFSFLSSWEKENAEKYQKPGWLHIFFVVSAWLETEPQLLTILVKMSLFLPSADTWYLAERRCLSWPQRMRMKTWQLSTCGCPAERPAQTSCRSGSSPRSTNTWIGKSPLSRGSLWAFQLER